MLFSRYGNASPFATFDSQLARLSRNFDRVIGQGLPGSSSSSPSFNVWSNENGAIVTSEMPGVKMEGMELTVSGRTITVKGSKTSQKDEKQGYIRRERIEGEFTRSFEMPFQIDSSKVKAKLSDGVLEISLPRAESDKPRKISLSGS